MTFFRLSQDNRFAVSLAVRSLGICDEVSISGALCDRISGSITAYLAEVCDRPDVSDWVGQLRSLTQLLLSDAPSIVLIRTRVARLPAPVIRQIESRAFRLADQVPACANVGSDLLGWSKIAPATDLIPLLRLCVAEGGAMVRGQDRPTGRQSAPHFEPIVFGRGRGMSWLPKLEGGRPADNAEVRLIVHLAVDWHLTTGFKPEAGRDGHSAFSGLVHDVFGWVGRSKKAKFSLRVYWVMMADRAGPQPEADQTAGN
jgi:hypothetical protein